MRSAWMLLVMAVAFLPTASAQVPDPAPIVDQACALLPGDASDAVPLCPRQEPNVPVEPVTADAPAQPDANPQDATALADAVKGQVEGAVEDPASAPSRLAAVVATVVQFVRDLLELPQETGAVVVDAFRGAMDAASGALASSLAATRDAVAEGFREAGSAISSLWFALPVQPEAGDLPVQTRASLPRQADASMLGDALKTVGVPART